MTHAGARAVAPLVELVQRAERNGREIRAIGDGGWNGRAASNRVVAKFAASSQRRPHCGLFNDTDYEDKGRPQVR